MVRCIFVAITAPADALEYNRYTLETAHNPKHNARNSVCNWQAAAPAQSDARAQHTQA